MRQQILEGGPPHRLYAWWDVEQLVMEQHAQRRSLPSQEATGKIGVAFALTMAEPTGGPSRSDVLGRRAGKTY